MNEFVINIKQLVELLFYSFLGSVLLYFISHIFMGIYKTLFCDIKVKLYKIAKKRLKHYLNDEELAKVLNDIKFGQKFY